MSVGASTSLRRHTWTLFALNARIYFTVYPACDHAVVAGRCTKCYWDGSVSEYCRKVKRAGAK
jgi:hypothetical protein